MNMSFLVTGLLSSRLGLLGWKGLLGWSYLGLSRWFLSYLMFAVFSFSFLYLEMMSGSGLVCRLYCVAYGLSGVDGCMMVVLTKAWWLEGEECLLDNC